MVSKKVLFLETVHLRKLQSTSPTRSTWSVGPWPPSRRLKGFWYSQRSHRSRSMGWTVHDRSVEFHFAVALGNPPNPTDISFGSSSTILTAAITASKASLPPSMSWRAFSIAFNPFALEITNPSRPLKLLHWLSNKSSGTVLQIQRQRKQQFLWNLCASFLHPLYSPSYFSAYMPCSRELLGGWLLHQYYEFWVRIHL